MKSISFTTPTLLSYIDLMSMGGSDKADNVSLIGTYNSGLKFSMALALRNDIRLTVEVFDTEYSENFDRKRCTTYTLDSYKECCDQTGKEKELIQLTKNVSKESFFSQHCEDLGGGDFTEEVIQTGFSTKMGIDWQLWMLLRELYSNMIDEEGSYYEDACPDVSFGTVVKLTFEEDSEFADIWNNRHLYINEREPLYTISDSVEALENDEGYLRIYKQNILVYKDEKIKSKFAYNIKFGEIDEKRILSNLYSVEGDISYAIKSSKNEDYLRAIILENTSFEKGEFLYDKSIYGTASDLVHKIACEIYEEFGEVSSYPWLINSIKERKDCGIGGKRIQNIGDSLYNYSSVVVVESAPIPHSEPDIEVEGVTLIDPFSLKIKKYYNFNLDVEVKKAKLKGSKCIADKFERCLIIDENFNIEADFPTLIVQYLDLTMQGNIINNLSEYICNLLKK
jgi:hypothetical protein